MDFASAKEARDAELQPFKVTEAQSKANSERLKYVMDFYDTSAIALSRSFNPQQVAALGDRMKQMFPEPELQASIDETVAELVSDPANFEVNRDKLLRRTMDAKDQTARDYIKQTTGTEERLISVPKFGGGGATEVAGSRIQVAPGMTYVRGADGAVYPMPSKSGGGFDTPAPAVGVPPTAGAPGRGNTADVVYGFGEFGSPSKPLSTLSIGEVQDFQRNTLIPKTRGQIGKGPRIGTGAVGTYQITYGTLQDYAPKVLGANWRNATFTADVQEQIAKAIYEDVKGENLKDTWAGLPSNRPGQYANVPWEQVRDQIIQVESAGGGKRGAAGAANAAPGAPVAIIPGKAPAPAVSPEKQKARAAAAQALYDAVQEAQKKGHLVSEKQSYVANRATELRQGRTYAPGGTAQKSSQDLIKTAAAQLLRQFVEKGTTGTMNAVAEQELFLKGVGGGDSTYETRLQTIRNFAKQNGIKLNEGGAAKSKTATPVTKAPPGVSAAEWKEMTPAERKLWP